MLPQMRTKLDMPEDEIRETLTRILESRSFEGVERLKRFLEFVVLETLAGRGEQIKEFAVGEYAFGKGASFDPRNDPIVRVQARRLRARLDRYKQSEGQRDTLCIDLPKGGYVPAFRRREATPQKAFTPTLLLDRTSVVIVPYVNQNGDAETEQLCRGITQDLAYALTRIEGLTVHASPPGQEIATRGSGLLGLQSNAATVVTGSIQRRGNSFRITSLLVDAASKSYIASDSLDRTLDAADFTLQDEVVSIVSSRIREGMTPEGWRSNSSSAPRNLAAQNLYLQGRYQLDQRTEESLRLAAGLFEKAISEDGQFAKAHAGLADAYELLGHYAAIAPVEMWTKALTSASTAVMLDDRSVEAHTAMAHVRSTQDWDWVGAEHEFRRALELDPRNATAHHWYATVCLAPMGRLDEALETIQTAHTLAPLSSIISRDLASIRYYRREYDLALEQCDQAIELNPFFSQAYWTLGYIQEQRQEHAEALAAFSRAVELAGTPRNKGAVGRMLAISGKRKAATAILRELNLLSERRYVSPLIFASLHFALEQPEEGYTWLKKSFQDRCFELLLIHVDPKFDSFRKNPQFLELASQLHLPQSNT